MPKRETTLGKYASRVKGEKKDNKARVGTGAGHRTK